jgi:hypothetical protein
MFDDILKKPAGPKKKVNLLSQQSPLANIELSVLEEIEEVLTEMDFHFEECVYCGADKRGKHGDVCFYHVTRTKVIDAIDHAYAIN